MDYLSGSNEYVLTGQDQSTYTFDDTSPYLLKSRAWPSSETWTYAYYDSGDGADLDGKLKQVDDGYGRLLHFAYYRDTETDVYKRRQLRRVGDHTASGLDGGSPLATLSTASMPSVTWPNTVYWPVRNVQPSSVKQMKNWLFALSGLLVRAMPSVPRLYI